MTKWHSKEIKEYALIFQENFDFSTIENELTAQSSIERINAIIFGLIHLP